MDVKPDVEIWVRATINLPELGQGEEVYVNPDVPYIARALERRYLIPVDEAEEAHDGEAEAADA